MNTNELPDPPVPIDANLRDLPYLPLYAALIRDSDFAKLSSAEAFRAGIMNMCAAWHQIPAGSLPNNDKLLADFAGYGYSVKDWLKVKEQALRGWTLHSDERLYHKVVSANVLKALDAKFKYEYEKFTDRMRKANKKHSELGQPWIGIPDFDTWKTAGRPADWNEHSSVIPTERHKKSDGIKDESNAVPLENGLKGREENGSNIINTLTHGVCQNSDFDPSLETINILLQKTGHQPTTQQKLNELLVMFNLKNADKQMTEKQKQASLLNYFKIDRSSFARQTKTTQNTSQSRLDVNTSWDDQPKNDQPLSKEAQAAVRQSILDDPEVLY
jgi:hypothetical protein